MLSAAARAGNPPNGYICYIFSERRIFNPRAVASNPMTEVKVDTENPERGPVAPGYQGFSCPLYSKKRPPISGLNFSMKATMATAL